MQAPRRNGARLAGAGELAQPVDIGNTGRLT
jgi:hypothetical protein